MRLSADQMRSLPDYFATIPDPRRAQGRRHRLPVVLALAAGATLCGMQGYKAMAEWVQALGQNARQRFGCRCENGYYVVPSEFVLRDCLVRVGPEILDEALSAWSQDNIRQDEPLAVDGKTMKGAKDEQGAQTHIISVIGHDSKCCVAQKKLAH